MSISISAQNNSSEKIEFIKGEIVKTKFQSYSTWRFVDNQILGLRIEDDDIVIRNFDAGSLDLIVEKKHPIAGGNSSHFFIEAFIISGSRCYLFYSHFDKKQTIERLYYIEVDPHSCEYVGNETKVLLYNGKVFSDWGSNKFSFIRSADKSKLMVYYRLRPESKNDNKSTDVFGFYIFDKNMKELWNTETSMFYPESKVDNLGFKVSNAGEVLMMTTVFNNTTSKMQKTRNAVNYHLELLKVENATSGVSKYPIEIDNVLIKSCKFQEMSNGDIVMGGIYANSNYDRITADFLDDILRGEPLDSDGMYGIRISSNGEIINLGYHEFPLNFLNAYEKKSKAKKNEKKGATKAKVKWHDNKYTMIGSDGSICCVGEQSYRKTDYDRTVNNIDYFYDDVSVSKIDSDMELAWIKKIPKRQTAINQNSTPLEISYLDFSDDKYLYILYKDDKDNVSLSKNEQPQKCNVLAGGVVMLSKINLLDGTVSKSILMVPDKSNKKMIRELLSSWLTEVDPGTFIFENHVSKKEFQLVKIVPEGEE